MTPIAKALKEIDNKEVILFTSVAENLLKNDIKTIKYLAKKGRGIYITINQPYVALKQILKRNNVNLSNIFFIDLISSTVSANPEKKTDCLFINSPTSLTELGISIEQILSSVASKEKFLFIDNLSAFLIYNELDILSEFSHFLISKMRISGVTGVIMSVEEEVGEKLINTIGGFCDQIIKIG